MRHVLAFLVPVVLGSGSLVGCKAGTNVGFGGSGGTSGTNGNGTAAGPSGTNGATNGSTAAFMTNGATTGSGTSCTTPDCLGGGMQGGCDAGLNIASGNGMDGAKAIGLCQQMSPGGWGVVSAAWTRADGSPLGMGDGGPNGDGDLQLGHGILDAFGSVTKPREGVKLLALSSGSARQPSDPNYHDVGGYWKDSGAHTAPAGYPKDSPSCPPGTVPPGTPIFDSAGLKLVIHTPSDAKSLSYDFNFHTYEFPGYVCSEFNDFFVALLTPKPANLIDSNISFDSMGNNISVNAGFLQVCTAQSAGGKNFPCALGEGALNGTGFEGHAATGWLNTKAPVPAASDITLQFSIWDSGDGILDSTVLIDNFKFQVDTTVTGTNPIPM